MIGLEGAGKEFVDSKGGLKVEGLGGLEIKEVVAKEDFVGRDHSHAARKDEGTHARRMAGPA